MVDRHKMILRAGALFGTMVKRSAARTQGAPVRIGLAAAPGISVTRTDEDEAKVGRGDNRQGFVSPEAQVETHVSVVRSVGEQLSFGGVLGFAAGYSIRKVGKAMLFLVGTEVVILQYMAYRQWLTMDWRRLGRDIAPKFTRSTWDGLVEVLVYKMPFSAAFSGGLFAGLRVSSAK